MKEGCIYIYQCSRFLEDGLYYHNINGKMDTSKCNDEITSRWKKAHLAENHRWDNHLMRTDSNLPMNHVVSPVVAFDTPRKPQTANLPQMGAAPTKVKQIHCGAEAPTINPKLTSTNHTWSTK